MRRVAFFVAAVVGTVGLVVPGTGRPADRSSRVVHLFNGKDLTGFYTWLGAPASGKEPYGKNHDPEKVFSVRDGAIRVSGKVFGGLITEKEYGNYHLVVEFKWGEKTWAPREKNARDSGILVHSTGPDGAVGGLWMRSVEFQMIEGGTGDLILVGGVNLTADADKRGREYYYHPGASPLTLHGGRFDWFGRDPRWKDAKGFRGSQDVEKPVGQWNRIECICEGDRITNILNGRVVNAGRNCSLTRGKILFQSEGAEVFFRRIDLQPLNRD